MSGASEIRLIVDPPAPGSWNMAVDESLLMAAAEENVATLRLYEWDEPTLSLGYFHRYEDRHQHAASQDCPIVRRQSGGGAILHDREMTYSLTLPAGHPLAQRPRQLYTAVHEAIIRLLTRLGPQGEPAGRLVLQSNAVSQPCSLQPPADRQPFLCFERRSPGDVVLVLPAPTSNPLPSEQNWKIVGSAQRRHRGAVLQHGSVLLSRSPAAPELPGYCDLTGATITVSTLATAFPTEVGTILESTVAAAHLPESVRETAQQIARDKYASNSWTARR